MKKFILLITAIVIAVSLAGCQSKEFPPEVSIEESTSRSAETITPIDTEDVEDTKIPNSQIYDYMDMEISWTVNPYIVENFIHENSLIVEAKILSTGKALFLYNDKTYYERPQTPVNIEISNVLYGKSAKENLTIYASGGDVLLKDVFEFNERFYPEKKEGKFGDEGLKGLSEKELSTKYMSYASQFDYTVSRGSEYLLILGYDEDLDVYTITAGGYGIFEKSTPNKRLELRQSLMSAFNEEVRDSLSAVDATSFTEYGNVLTGIDFDLSVLP